MSDSNLLNGNKSHKTSQVVWQLNNAFNFIHISSDVSQYLSNKEANSVVFFWKSSWIQLTHTMPSVLTLQSISYVNVHDTFFGWWICWTQRLFVMFSCITDNSTLRIFIRDFWISFTFKHFCLFLRATFF